MRGFASVRLLLNEREHGHYSYVQMQVAVDLAGPSS